MSHSISGRSLGDLQPAAGEDTAAGQRRQADRRRWPTSPWDALRLWGRRTRVRRREERRGAFFVDQFDAPTLAFTVAVLVLSLVDGVLTILLLDLNSEEANPLMRLLLQRGKCEFLLGKYVLTAAGLPFLVVFKNWPLFGSWFRVGYLLPILAAMYLILLAYQLHLLHL